MLKYTYYYNAKLTKKYIFIFLVSISFIKSRAQDTSYIKKITAQAEALLSKNIGNAYNLSLKAYSLVKKYPNSNCYFQSVLVLSKVYYQKDEPDSIINLITPILAQLPVNTSKYYVAGLHHKLSSAYIMQLKLELGLKHCIYALKDYELINDSVNTVNILINIGSVYQQQRNFIQANKYMRQAECKALQLKNKTVLGNVYNTLGILYAENDKLDSAEKFFLFSTSIREKLNDNTSVVWNYNNLGGLYVLLKKPKQAIFYLEKALNKFQNNKNYDGETSVANNLGELYLQAGDKKKALFYFSYSRNLYNKTNNPDNLENLYTNLSTYYDQMGDLKTAFKYSDSLIVLKDKLYGKRLDESTAEMQTKYETEKKEKENLALTNKNNKNEIEILETKNQRTIIFSVLALLTLLFIIVFIRQKNKQKQILATEKLKQEKIKIETFFLAQEKERERISQDLHDGVAQTLGAAKLNLSALETITTNPTIYTTTINLIDESVVEIRNISHNLMPALLYKSGLTDALQEMALKINSANKLKVEVDFDQSIKRFSNFIEINTYRIIQEWLNNVIKHANATEVMIQLTKDEKELTIMIEDNGNGFDKAKLNQSKGNGWANIQSRLTIINGFLEIDSTAKKGTNFFITVPLIA